MEVQLVAIEDDVQALMGIRPGPLPPGVPEREDEQVGDDERVGDPKAELAEVDLRLLAGVDFEGPRSTVGPLACASTGKPPHSAQIATPPTTGVGRPAARAGCGAGAGCHRRP
jgi:hypothetical protein